MYFCYFRDKRHTGFATLIPSNFYNKPRGLFLVKRPFRQIFLWKSYFFCSSNCNFLKFSARSLSLLLIFLLFVFNNVLATVNTHNVYLIKYLPPKFNVMFKFNYSKYNPRRGLIFGGGGLIHGRSFRFKSWFPNTLGLIYSGAYYRNFTVFRKRRLLTIPLHVRRGLIEGSSTQSCILLTRAYPYQFLIFPNFLFELVTVLAL